MRTKNQRLRDRAWKVFSIWVRNHKADFAGYTRCYTCNRKFRWQEMNAGHYRHDAYDFDPENVKAQCVHCNLGESGRADNFYLHLVKDYGKKRAEYLRTRAKHNDYSIEELEAIIKHYALQKIK